MTRARLARVSGVSYASLRRLEYELAPDAPLWWYRNLAIALEVSLDEILDERDLQWRGRWPDASTPPPLGWFDPVIAARMRPNALAAD